MGSGSDQETVRSHHRPAAAADLRQRADRVRAAPLEPVLVAWGAVRDRRDPRKWHTDRGPISISGPKFYNWRDDTGGGGAIDLVLHLAGVDFPAAIVWLETHLGLGPLPFRATRRPPTTTNTAVTTPNAAAPNAAGSSGPIRSGPDAASGVANDSGSSRPLNAPEAIAGPSVAAGPMLVGGPAAAAGSSRPLHVPDATGRPSLAAAPAVGTGSGCPLDVADAPRTLQLPARDDRRRSRMIEYLTEQRHLQPALLQHLWDVGRLYADHRANAVFLLVAGKPNRPVGAELRGTGPRPWRGMAPGTRKDLGYFWIGGAGSKNIVLCESAIDAVSCLQLHPGTICISTAGVRPNPRWLAALIARGYHIHCGFDADEPGDTAAARMLKLHPTIQRLRPPAPDWNHALTHPHQKGQFIQAHPGQFS